MDIYYQLSLLPITLQKQFLNYHYQWAIYILPSLFFMFYFPLSFQYKYSLFAPNSELLIQIFPFIKYNILLILLAIIYMKIVEVDDVKTKIALTKKLTWKQRFTRNMYQNNYSKWIRQQPKDQDIQLKEEYEKKEAIRIARFVQHSKKHKNNGNQEPSDHSVFKIYESQTNISDPQQYKDYYSPYSTYIPLKHESFIANQVINTFPYAKHLKDTQKPQIIKKIQIDLQDALAYDKKRISVERGLADQMNNWLKFKKKYLCNIDAIKALTIYLHIKRVDYHRVTTTIKQFYIKYGRQVKKQVFFQRIFRTVMYLRSTNRMHANLPVSIQITDPINEKTISETMKTWYCSICLIYDCQNHTKGTQVGLQTYHYVSRKNIKKPLDHVKQVAIIIKFYQKMMMPQTNRDSEMGEENKILQSQDHKMDEQSQRAPCSQSCYLLLNKEEMKKLNPIRHQLISPLASSLLKLGIQMFSYNPCLIHRLFSSKFSDPKNGIAFIPCSLIFLHFAVQQDLIDRINKKLMENQFEFLMNQTRNQEILKINPPLKFGKKLKEKMQKNLVRQTAMCFHYIGGKSPIDQKCNNCVCKSRGFCLPSCLCSEYCQLKRQGCKCVQSCEDQKCICFFNNLECQPGLCHSCFPREHEKKKNSCNNDQILRGSTKKMVIGLSNIPGAGLGCFANENYRKKDLICIYSGENISMHMDQVRQCSIKDLSFYNFDSPNRPMIEASIDARYKGNKARFINHCNDGKENLESKTMYSNGCYYIALYATTDIKIGEELTFNYDGNGKLFTHFHDKYPFILPPKKK